MTILKVNKDAYATEFMAQSEKMHAEFREMVRTQHGRELNEAEEAQLRVASIQCANALFFMGEFERGTKPDDVVMAYAVAVSGGLANYARESGIDIVKLTNAFTTRVVLCIKKGEEGQAFESVVPSDPFVEN